MNGYDEENYENQGSFSNTSVSTSPIRVTKVSVVDCKWMWSNKKSNVYAMTNDALYRNVARTTKKRQAKSKFAWTQDVFHEQRGGVESRRKEEGAKARCNWHVDWIYDFGKHHQQTNRPRKNQRDGVSISKQLRRVEALGNRGRGRRGKGLLKKKKTPNFWQRRTHPSRLAR